MLDAIISFMFGKAFGGYVYPFSKSNDRIASMKPAERTEYYRQARELVENRAYKQEIEEIVRKFYQELALKTGSQTEMQAYRLTLKAIQELDGRLKALASLYSPPAVNKTSDAINRL